MTTPSLDPKDSAISAIASNWRRKKNPRARNEPDHKSDPTASDHRKRATGVSVRPAIGGAMVESPGTNFATISVHNPSRRNHRRELLTQESGSSEIRHSVRRTRKPFTRPSAYQTESLIRHAT